MKRKEKQAEYDRVNEIHQARLESSSYVDSTDANTVSTRSCMAACNSRSHCAHMANELQFLNISGLLTQPARSHSEVVMQRKAWDAELNTIMAALDEVNSFLLNPEGQRFTELRPV